MGATTTGAMLALLAIAAAPPSGRQAAYDAAQAAFDRDDWTAAADGFAPLLPPGDGPLKGSLAVIAARRAIALGRLERYPEAEPLGRRALDGLPPANTGDIGDLWNILGDAARDRYETDAAVADYDRAAATASRSGDVGIRARAATGTALATMTVAPEHAEAAMATLLDDAALVKQMSRKNLSVLEQLRARAALNRGDLKGARQWIDRAIGHAGGSTSTRVGLLDVSLRGDAAIIAQRNDQPEEARQYLTYSGAGHLKSADWVGAYGGTLPVCGTDGDIRPDDFAVVELSVDKDGNDRLVQPIYASRPGDVGIAFARAVRGWHWDPAKLVGVDEFWRAGLRIELRCEMRPAPERLAAPFIRRALEQEGSIAGDASGIYWNARNRPKAGTPRAAEALLADRLARLVPPFVSAHPGTAEAAWLQLEWALALEEAGRFEAARPIIVAVLATPAGALGEDDPVREVAELHRALIARRTGDAAAAPAGADSESCALIDTRPIPTNLSIVSSQFPLEALHWRFQGDVRIAYDIGVDGRPTGIRTIFAYPPFVFGPATEKAATAFRYLAPTIDGRPVGCVGETQNVSYRIPGT